MTPLPPGHRIGVLSASTFSQEGGIQRVTQTVLRFLRDHFPLSPVDLYSLHDHEASPPCPELARAARQGLFSYHAYGAARLRYSHAVMRYLLQRRPALVIADHAHLGVLPWLAKQWYAFRFVTFVHHAELATLRLLRLRALHSSDLIIANSSFTAREALRVLGGHENLAVCHLGLFPEYPERAARAPARPAPLRGRRTVLTVGRMMGPARDKGQETLLRATAEVARHVPDVLLVLVGQGEDRPRLLRLAHDLNVTNHVHFAGAVPDRDLPAYYEAAEVFAMPSRAEGFGLVYLEAMYHGKPCVATPTRRARWCSTARPACSCRRGTSPRRGTPCCGCCATPSGRGPWGGPAGSASRSTSATPTLPTASDRCSGKSTNRACLPWSLE